MGHVGDIGRGGGRRGLGDGTRTGPAPTADGTPQAGPTADGAQGPGGEGTGEAGPGPGRTGERPALRTGERPALRTGERPGLPPGTGERPALRTGERPALRTGERPALRTGERPALPTTAGERGQSRTTGSRPALPAATFADALTTGGGGKRVSTGAETLVMPKVEVPEPPGGMTRGGRAQERGGRTQEMPVLRDGMGQTSGDTSNPAREGRTVTTMSTPIGGGTRIVRMPELPGKERAEGEDTQSGREGKEARRGGRSGEPRSGGKDGFGATPSTGNRPALGNAQVRGPVLPVGQLIPSGLGNLGDLLAVAKRFASDLPLLHQQVLPSDLPPTDRALRAWAFFTAYAEAAAAQESTPEGKEAFDKALKEQGFGEYRDARTGHDGLKAAKWVLESSNAEEARARADQVELEPPPEVLLSEAARKSEAAQPQEAARKAEEQSKEAARAQGQEVKDSAFTQSSDRPLLERKEGQSEFVRVNPQLADTPRPVVQQPVTPGPRQEEDESLMSRADDAWKKLGGNLRLGRNMLWNVLHRFRGSEEDSANEKEKWSQIAFAAVLAFVGLMLLVILVVSL